jgi:hypothetical protein
VKASLCRTHRVVSTTAAGRVGRSALLLLLLLLRSTGGVANEFIEETSSTA